MNPKDLRMVDGEEFTFNDSMKGDGTPVLFIGYGWNSAHLDQGTVAMMIPMLQRFVETGRLTDGKPKLREPQDIYRSLSGPAISLLRQFDLSTKHDNSCTGHEVHGKDLSIFYTLRDLGLIKNIGFSKSTADTGRITELGHQVAQVKTTRSR